MSRRNEALVSQEIIDEHGEAPEPVLGSEESPRPRSLRRQQQPVAIIRIARLWPGGERAAAAALPAVTPVDLDPMEDSLEAFGSEAVAISAAPLVPATATGPVVVPMPAAITAEPGTGRWGQTPEAKTAQPRNWAPLLMALRWVAIVALGAAAAAAGAWIYRQRLAAPATGSLTIQTNPAGLSVAVNGQPSGVTPLTLTLAPASYLVQIGDGAQRRELAVNLAAGSSILQHLELPVAAAAEAAPTTGALLIQTEPSGQTVTVDGVERGVSPLTVESLEAGDHAVVVRGARGTLKRSVTVKAGGTVSLLVAPVAPTAPAPGWLSVQSGTRLEMREAGKLLGTTETEQIMLTAGHHDIELVNDAIGYRSRRQVEILPGQVTTVPVEMPFGAVSINAQPWAEVWIGGDRVGETPIANLARRVGTYEVVFKHPEFGERRETINVTLRQPARLGVDMRSKQQ